MTKTKFFSQRRLKIVFLGIFIFLAVAATFSTLVVFWPGLKWRQVEPSLLSVCWQNGEAVYPFGNEGPAGHSSGNSCEAPENIVWRHAPLNVGVHPGRVFDVSKAQKEVSQAAKSINRELGFSMLQFRKVGIYDVTVYWGWPFTPGEASAPAFAYHRRANKQSLVCGVFLRDVTSYTMTYRLLRHELLHCVGLAHDPGNKRSVMNPNTVSDLFLPRTFSQFITDADRRNLRGLYMGKSRR